VVATGAAPARTGPERLTAGDLSVPLGRGAMGAAGLSSARLRRLYYGAADPKGGAVESGVRFFSAPTCHHRPEIYGGIGEAAAAALLRDFFKARRGCAAPVSAIVRSDRWNACATNARHRRQLRALHRATHQLKT